MVDIEFESIKFVRNQRGKLEYLENIIIRCIYVYSLPIKKCLHTKMCGYGEVRITKQNIRRAQINRLKVQIMRRFDASD